MVDQAVRQDIDFLENHLVDVRVPVIAGLRKKRHGNQVDTGPVFPLYHLGHRHARGQCSRVQQCLGDSVAHARPEQAIARAIGIDFPGELAEPRDRAPEKQGGDMVANFGNGLRCAENGSPAAGTGILDLGAIPQCDLAVRQYQHDRHRRAGLPDGPKSGSQRIAHIKKAVVRGAGPDCGLVIAIEPGAHGFAHDVDDLHSITSPPFGPKV